MHLVTSHSHTKNHDGSEADRMELPIDGSKLGSEVESPSTAWCVQQVCRTATEEQQMEAKAVSGIVDV